MLAGNSLVCSLERRLRNKTTYDGLTVVILVIRTRLYNIISSLVLAAIASPSVKVTASVVICNTIVKYNSDVTRRITATPPPHGVRQTTKNLN